MTTSDDPRAGAGAGRDGEAELLASLGRSVREELHGEVDAEAHAEARARLLERAGGVGRKSAGRRRSSSDRSVERASRATQRSAGDVAAARRGREIGPAARVDRRWALSALALAAALALVLVVANRSSKHALTFAIDGRTANAGAAVRADGRALAVRFEDGTDVVFAPGSTGRIAEVSPHGARIVVGEGRAHFKVEHLPGAQWSVEAGPYVVRVTGTEFDLEWSRARSSLRVAMVHGSVAVEGAKSSVPSLVTGDELEVADDGTPSIHPVGSSLARASTANEGEGAKVATATPSDARAAAPSDARAAAPSEAKSEAKGEAKGETPAGAERVPSGAGASAVGGAGPRASSTAEAASEGERAVGERPRGEHDAGDGDRDGARSAAAATWTKRVEDGRYEEVVTEASSRGLDGVLDTASLEDLGALAEAARYSGHADVAAKALFAVRRRFPSSSTAHDAAFLLGRMAEAKGSSQKAIALYDEYLASGGTFSEEALGRKLMVLDASKGRDAALPIARDYLSRFPKGAFAKAASRILETP